MRRQADLPFPHQRISGAGPVGWEVVGTVELLAPCFIQSALQCGASSTLQSIENPCLPARGAGWSRSLVSKLEAVDLGQDVNHDMWCHSR
jgi:hypothetical protein